MNLTQTYFETTDSPHFAAEFDYFRIAPKFWILMLTRLRQMGVSTISVTIPWGFHQFQPNSIDLTGTTNTRRNLVGLIKLCDRMGFFCILKPGPYAINGNILNNGLPSWFSTGANKYPTGLSAAVKNWYRTLSKALVKYQWPEGPIAALSLDFESGQKQQVAPNKQLTGVKWPIWLRKRYEGMEALNKRYDSDYRTVNDVAFPTGWADETSPLQEDAREFLSEIRQSSQQNYLQPLADAGWQTPVYFSGLNTAPDLPQLQSCNMTQPINLSALDTGHTIITLRCPIQLDPTPPDAGTGPVWAKGAPIRADGSVRRSFWRIRQSIWQHCLPDATVDGQTFIAPFETWGLVTAAQDTAIKIVLPKGSKPTPYRLWLNGELLVDNILSAARSRLKGTYLTEDDSGQTDLAFYQNTPAEPVAGFLSAYLKDLLTAQIYALAWAAGRANKLGQSLLPGQLDNQGQPQAKPRQSPHTISDARRGLKEAEAALRKAMASIGGLETGFDTMLGKSRKDIPQVATESVAITADAFEGVAQDTIVLAGEVCADIATQLKSVAESLQNTVTATKNLITVEQYQTCYNTAVNAAVDARTSLLAIIARFRSELSAGQLPLVTWRVHNQLQAIAEGLRWGVLRE